MRTKIGWVVTYEGVAKVWKENKRFRSRISKFFN